MSGIKLRQLPVRCQSKSRMVDPCQLTPPVVFIMNFGFGGNRTRNFFSPIIYATDLAKMTRECFGEKNEVFKF